MTAKMATTAVPHESTIWRSLHLTHGCAVGQIGHDVIHGENADAGQQERQIDLFVFGDAVPRQTGIYGLFHCALPPVARMVRVSEIF